MFFIAYFEGKVIIYIDRTVFVFWYIHSKIYFYRFFCKKSSTKLVIGFETNKLRHVVGLRIFGFFKMGRIYLVGFLAKCEKKTGPKKFTCGPIVILVYT